MRDHPAGGRSSAFPTGDRAGASLTSSFKASDLTRAIRAARAAGLETFDVHIDDRGLPVIRVRAGERCQDEVTAEIEAWAKSDDDNPWNAIE
jgi:hypothetical protein